MDSNGKLFGKLSIFDLIVIIVLIVVAAGTYYRFSSEKTNVDGGQTSLAYTMRIVGVREFTLQYYKEGLRCFDTKTGEEIGVITAVRSEPLKDNYVGFDGEITTLEVPETLKIELDIETQGLETDQGYFARGVYELKAGSEMFLTTKYVSVEGVVDRVSVK